MDTIYPEPVSQIYRRMGRRKGSRLAARYRTLPVTFSEIQEVDEENLEGGEEEEEVAGYDGQENETDDAGLTCGVMSSKSDHDLKSKFLNHPTLSERNRRVKQTKKSVNRKLLLDCHGTTNAVVSKPGIQVTPSSPDSPPLDANGSEQKSVFRPNLNSPRTSI